MQELRNEVPLRLSTADGREVIATATVDRETELWLRSAAQRQVDVEIRESKESDVSGHSAGDTSVLVVVRYPGGGDEDVEGHAMSLRFPTMEAAHEFEKRMVATGALVAVMAVAVVGAGVASQTGSDSIAAPAAGAAPAQVVDTNRDVGIADRSTTYAPAAQVVDTNRDVGIADRSTTYAPAAPAASSVDTDRDTGIADRTTAASSTASAADDEDQRPGDRRR